MHAVLGQQALGVAQQAGAVGRARGVLDLLEQRVETLRLVAPVVARLGEVAQVERLDVRDQRQVVVLRAVGAAEPLCPFHVLQLHGDADFGQLGGDDLAALACVGRGRQRHGEVQRGFDAGLGDQLFRLVQVVGVDAGGVHVAEGARHVVAADGHAQAVGRCLDDGLAVDGGGDGAAHAHVLQRLARVVHGQDGLGARAADDDLEARVGLELLDAARRHAREGVHVARQQRGDLRRRVGNETEGGTANARAARVAVAVPACQRERGALGPVVEPVGAGAHGLGGVGGGALGLDDDGSGLAEQEQQIGLDVLVDEHHGVFIDHLHAQVGEGALVFVGALVAAGALEGELHGSSVARRTVVEGHAAAQPEGVGLEVGRDLPALGQQGRDAAVGVDLGERLEHVVEHHFADGRGRARRRVQPGGLQHQGQRQRVFLALGPGAQWRKARGGSGGGQGAASQEGSAVPLHALFFLRGLGGRRARRRAAFLHHASALQARIEQVAQAVAQQVQSEHGQGNGRAGPHGQQRCLVHQRLRLAQHAAP